MIVKSYEIKKFNIEKYNLFLLYGENLGLKKDIKKFFQNRIKEKDDNIETLSLYENEVLANEENFYNLLYSGSLFANKKIITLYDATDKVTEKISDIYDKCPENIFLIIFTDILEKKSKLRNFFEKNKKTICTPCYLDTEKDLTLIAYSELKKNNISVSGELVSLLVQKSNFDRNNLRNEMEKIVSYSLNKKKLEIDEIESLINFSGDYKSDILINECLSGNVPEYKKIISELYANTINQIMLLRILSNKIQRLLKIKEQKRDNVNIDKLIEIAKPSIFWKEKPIVKKQLSIWNLYDLKKIISEINSTEVLCKKNPQISKIIFFNFLTKVCEKANSFS